MRADAVRRQLRPAVKDDARPDSGFTLLELMVAMGILSLVLALSFTVVAKIISTTAASQARSSAVDEARNAVEQMERQIRSGNVITAPTYDSARKLWLLQVYTQVNGNQRCVQWRVNANQDTLQFRSWSPSWAQDGDITPWGAVAQYIVNDPVNSSDTPFVRTNDTTFGTRLLTIHLLVQATGQPAATVIDTSVTGRNTSFGYDQAVCTTAVPGG